MGEKLTGFKRQILVDTGVSLLKALMHPADISDKEGGMKLLNLALPGLPAARKVWADRGYLGLVEWA